MKLATTLLAASWVLAATAGESTVRMLEEVRLPPASLAPLCSPIEGEYAISIQAATLYRLVDEEFAKDLLARPNHKAFQSFACSGAKSTIYYYEYANKEDADHALGFVKGLIWGEGGRSRMHPEMILPVENVLVVISSRDAEFFANDFIYGIPGEAGKVFGKALDLYGQKNFTKAEKRFRDVTRIAPDLALGHLYLGHCLYFEAKYHEAIPEYERTKELAAKSGGLTQVNERILGDQLGISYASDGRLADAKAEFETAIKRDPEYPMSYYNLACTFAELGDLDDALMNLKLGHDRKEHMLPGEIYPDPRTDDSFQRYLDDGKFKAAMKELGY